MMQGSSPLLAWEKIQSTQQRDPTQVACPLEAPELPLTYHDSRSIAYMPLPLKAD